MVRRSVEELEALSMIDPEIDAIVNSDQFPRTELDHSDPVKAINQLRAVADAYVPAAPKDMMVHHYYARDGHKNKLLVLKPDQVHDKLPLIVDIHGGGGCMGSPEAMAPWCKAVAEYQNAVVITPQYRLAPEYKFPYAINDCVDAVKHIAANAASFGADPAFGFVIGGHSIGASMSAMISLHAEELELNAKITGLFMDSASFMVQAPEGFEDQYRSATDPKCMSSPIYDTKTKALFGSLYSADLISPWARALNHPSPKLESQPRSYFAVCGMDMLRDDSLIYEQMLKNVGVPTRLNVYAGAPHVFAMYFHSTKQATRWREDSQGAYRWLLEKSS